MSKQASIGRLMWSFVKTGIIGFGGGPSVIPLIKHEVVTRYNWLSDESFSQTFSLANALPGPIATKMAAYVGYELKGIWGLIVAVISHILPSAVAITVLITMFNSFSSSPIVQGMISAVVPVVVVMLAMMTYEFMNKTWKGFGWIASLAVFAVVYVLMEIVQLHSAILVIAFIALGATRHKWMSIFKKRKGEQS